MIKINELDSIICPHCFEEIYDLDGIEISDNIITCPKCGDEFKIKNKSKKINE